MLILEVSSVSKEWCSPGEKIHQQTWPTESGPFAFVNEKPKGFLFLRYIVPSWNNEFLGLINLHRLPVPGCCQAGNKQSLAKSASYPYEFGLAVAGLVRDLGPRPTTDLVLPEGVDDSGALDDFTKGLANTWWRHL